jgi:hypothetical protein
VDLVADFASMATPFALECTCRGTECALKAWWRTTEKIVMPPLHQIVI